MNFYSSFLSLNNTHSKIKNLISGKYFFYVFPRLLLALLFSSCVSSGKFTDKSGKEIKPGAIPVRVLVNERVQAINFIVNETIKISGSEKTVAVVKKGNRINISPEGGKLSLSIGTQTFSSASFRFFPGEPDEILSFNGKKYRGSIHVTTNAKVINIVPLEDYLKGVIPAEMPVGKDEQNFEALKAFAICARTYTMMKLNENKPDFDLYIDVRDQVYGGAENEKPLSNRAITETDGMVLEYHGELASVFYHSTCGGYTEKGGNVFAAGKKPYLIPVKDGDEPNCIIAPKFLWEEKYSSEEFAARLLKNGLIPSPDFSLQSVKIISRFESGRVNELEINLESIAGENKTVNIFGNQIRSIIRTADNKSILRSTIFEISNDTSYVLITGRGYGHGVGMCQWGAIAQSAHGKGYEKILSHYFPGTEIIKLQE